MIGYLKGEVAAIYEDRIVLEVNCVGYNIFMPLTALERIGGNGCEIKVYTYLSVREDALQLYGFLSKDDLDFYKLLITVNGVGPKAALAILSAMTTEDLRFAILSGDAKAISKAPGIGAKTAQRLILDLKDKVNFEEAFEAKLEKSGNADTDTLQGIREEASQALIALGYSATDALRAVRKVEYSEDDDVETILKKALKLMI